MNTEIQDYGKLTIDVLNVLSGYGITDIDKTLTLDAIVGVVGGMVKKLTTHEPVAEPTSVRGVGIRINSTPQQPPPLVRYIGGMKMNTITNTPIKATPKSLSEFRPDMVGKYNDIQNADVRLPLIGSMFWDEDNKLKRVIGHTGGSGKAVITQRVVPEGVSPLKTLYVYGKEDFLFLYNRTHNQ